MSTFWVIRIIVGIVILGILGIKLLIELDKPKYEQPPDQIGNDNEMW